MGRTRLIIISGLSYTGKTTLGKALAFALDWKFISAGSLFREECKKQGQAITAIPDEIHKNLDGRIICSLRKMRETVVEGRYLGLFCHGDTTILKLLTRVDTQIRIDRCRFRESLPDNSFANQFLMTRDSAEMADALRLYKKQDFLEESLFDLVIDNNNEEDMKNAISLVTKVISQ